MYRYNLGKRFREISSLYGGKTALCFSSGHVVTYAELNETANRLAHFLLAQGFVNGAVLCIAGYKTIPSYATMLACIKLGIPYVILDPDSPVERLSKIIHNCQPHLLLGTDDFNKRISSGAQGAGVRTLNMSEVESLLPECSSAEPHQIDFVTGSSPAYVMYTSGSTGFPKGAVITHASVINLIDWGQETFGITHNDILTNVNPLYFDNSVFDFYSALFTGACLVPFDKDEVRDPRLLVDKVASAGCTVWFSVPSLLIFLQTMRATDGKNLGSIRKFIFGGEGYPKAKLKQLYDKYKESEFFNVYGPTECTCICSSYQLSDDDFLDVHGFPPLGTIANNFSYLILDDDGKGVAIGAPGELCLLGPNVGLGYYNDAERTLGSFVQNPYNSCFRELMYRTGDLVRQDEVDGKLYILGRKDNQIKHMGYRIELEEIENALSAIPGVHQAVAVHGIINGNSRIIAAISSTEDLDEGHIRQQLTNSLPDYMIPGNVTMFEALPKNQNGKVDRATVRSLFFSS